MQYSLVTDRIVDVVVDSALGVITIVAVLLAIELGRMAIRAGRNMPRTLAEKQVRTEAVWEAIAAKSSLAYLDIAMLRHGMARGAYESYEDALARFTYVVAAKREARQRAIEEAARMALRQQESQHGACQAVAIASGVDPAQLTSWSDDSGVHVRTPWAIEHTEEVEQLACSAAGTPVRIHDTERTPASLEPGQVIQLRRPS